MPETVRTPIFQRYSHLEKIGSGSMGAVYKARDQRLDREVALKILPPGLREDAEMLERFRREARTLAQLKHPGVASVFDADVEGDFPYLVMEFVEGDNLEQLLQRRTQLPVGEVIRIGIEMAEALEHIHCHGIIHRDLKSANTIIGPEGRAVVVDFGIAHVGSLPRISQGTLGTPEYMSPEQADGRTMDGRSDIYSVGVILYECLTGVLPFPRQGDSLSSLSDVLQRVLHEPPSPLREKRKDVPVWLEDVILRCLSKRPEDRFTSAAELAVALRKERYDQAQAFEDAHDPALTTTAPDTANQEIIPPAPDEPPSLEDIVSPPTSVGRRVRKPVAHQVAQGLVISHLESVDAIAFAPNGHQLVSTSKDGGIRLWDARSGRLAHLMRGHNALAVSFSKGGSRMATGGVDGAICIWDPSKEQPLHRLEAHQGYVLTVQYSRDGKHLASGGIDGAVRIWRAKTGRLIRTLGWQYGYVLSVSFSPDGRRLASGGADGAVRIWDVGTGDALKKLKGHAGYVASVSFSKDGKRLASGSADGTIRIWNVAKGTLEHKLEGHTDWVTSVAFKPDGTQLVSGSRDRTVCLWDIESGQGLRRFRGHKGAITTVAFSPDGCQLASSSSDHTVRVWSLVDRLPTRRLSRRTTVALAIMLGFGALGIGHPYLPALSIPDINWQGLWERVESVVDDAASSVKDLLGSETAPDGQASLAEAPPASLPQNASPTSSSGSTTRTSTSRSSNRTSATRPPDTPSGQQTTLTSTPDRAERIEPASTDRDNDSPSDAQVVPVYTSNTYESGDDQEDDQTNPEQKPGEDTNDIDGNERGPFTSLPAQTEETVNRTRQAEASSKGRESARNASHSLFSSEPVFPILDTFTLIVGDKPTRQEAARIASDFHENGYRTGILRIVFDGKLTYRVAVGQFRSYAEASTIRQSLAGQALPYDTWIMRIRTK